MLRTTAGHVPGAEGNAQGTAAPMGAARGGGEHRRDLVRFRRSVIFSQVVWGSREQHSRQREQHVGWLGGGSHVVLSSVAPLLTVGDDTSVFPAFLMGAHLSQSP